MLGLIRTACVFLAVLLASCGGGNGDSSSPTEVPHASTSIKAQQAAADYTNVVQQLYVSYYGRPGDPAGLSFWASYLAAGSAPTDLTSFVAAYGTNAAVKTVMENFGTSAESVALYGTSNIAIVNAIYQNLFNRPPTPADCRSMSTA